MFNQFLTSLEAPTIFVENTTNLIKKITERNKRTMTIFQQSNNNYQIIFNGYYITLCIFMNV